MGSLANSALRKKRIQVHQIFDQIWKQGILNRQDAYRWLAEKFCLERCQWKILYEDTDATYKTPAD